MTKKHYAHYLGAPEFYELDQACRTIKEAFYLAEFSGVYLVGSSLVRPDYRDVDVRCMLDDATFERMFPGADAAGGDWLHHPGWALLSSAMTVWLAQRTRLKIDFQFQGMTGANAKYGGPEHPRNALG